MKNIAQIFAISALVSASAYAQPAPQSSEYLKTVGGGAQIERTDGVSTVYFSLLLEWNKSPPPSAFLVAEFENTQNAESPYLVEKPVAELDAKPILRSPIYPCIINNSRYKVVVKVFSDQSKKTLLTTHDQHLAFAIPKTLLRDLDLKVCGGA